MNRILTATLVLTAVALGGCDGPLSCTLIGSRTGISLTIDPAYAPKVGAARMTTCWNSACTATSLTLSPSTTSVPLPCTPSGPDSACGARMEPTGGKTSFADLANLPSEPVEVTVDLIDPAGATLASPRLVITPKVSYPNGPECGGGTPQGGLLVSPDGTLSETM